MSKRQDGIALVVIGRNEGDRLVRCLRSAQGQAEIMVYVDSSSQDESVANARRLGVQVVELDMAKPFSAARARNEGWQRALQLCPTIEFIQFVDGDCELLPHWMAQARQTLLDHPNVVAVCGRRRERFPEASIYNHLCDLEWNTPVGEVLAVGGDAMFRSNALVQSKGYRADVVAGEEPELCVRLRQAGGKIMRINADMTLHDANIHRFKQWWTRAKRGGYAYALGAHLHGQPPERHWVMEYRRALAWGLWLPLGMLAFSLIEPAVAGAATLIYPLQILRLALRNPTGSNIPWHYAVFTVLGKVAEAQGCLRFLKERRERATPRIIEYK
jgi:glycosyltransferase involved in cell wall biosynthesis